MDQNESALISQNKEMLSKLNLKKWIFQLNLWTV